MAIFNRIPPDELRRNFTHYGRMYGLVPVYIGHPESEVPLIAVRNWWPDWLLDAADVLYWSMCWVLEAINPVWENPGFMIQVGRKIEA